uniref:Uncharacterized protein n=1 Tax=Syphacia muris TaxID=451379 RepID=A0A158R4Z5_9BILA
MKEKKLLAGMSAKARTVTSGSSNDCEDMKRSEQVASRAHSALPATVRPVSSARSPSPMDVSTASGIDPDLVAKDRYDPASKCFSYVPARALNEHFTTPRKPLQWIRVEEPREKILDVAPSASEIASVSVAPTELVRRADTPKWDDEIDKVTEEYNRRYGGKSEIYRSKSSVSNVDSKLNGPSRTETPIDLNSEIEEKPIVGFVALPFLANILRHV